MTIRDGLAWVAGLLLALAAVGLVAGPGVRRRLSVLCTLPLLGVPFVAPVAPPFRWLLAFLAAWAVIRAIDLAHRGFELPAWRRAAHLVAPFDTRVVRRVPPVFLPAPFARAVGFSLLAAAGFWVALGVPADPTLHLLVRWSAGAVASYAVFDAMVALGLLIAGLLGGALPKIHDDPILSLTVREFWGKRWNLVVHGWLRTFIFEPIRPRAGAYAAFLATFVVSAAHHAYLFWPAVGAKLGGAVGLFFLVQLAALALESRLGVRRWPPAPARAFTLAALGLTSPLIIEPALRVIESGAGLSW